MAEIIARVGRITGEAIARDPDGNVRRLKAGDPIREGDVVQTTDGAQVLLRLADGRDLTVNASEAAKIDAEVAAPDLPSAGDSAVQNSPRGFLKVAKAIVGADGTFSFVDDAGLVRNAADQKDGHTFIELVRIIENVEPLAFQFATERGQRLDEIRGGWSRVFNVPNNPPDSVDLKIAGSEDRVAEVRLAGSDGDGAVVGFAIISLPQHGVLYSDAALTTPIRVGDTVLGPVFFKLDANWNGQASFQYAAIDNVGLQDASPATATITVASVDDDVSLAVPDVNGGATGQLSVAENATTTGAFTINAPDGLDPSAALTIAGTPVSKAALESSGTTAVEIVTPEGRLTITGYNPVTGVVTYSYDPSGTAKNHTAGEVTDLISIVVKDEDGDTQSGTLTINIADTVPVAKPDANAITEDAATDVVVGNVVMTGVGADIPGADAMAVTGVAAGSAVPGSNVAAGSTSVAGGTVVAGLYGSLVLGADGSYSYRLDNTNAAVNALKTGETLSETFTYTITDADGDPSTTTLTLTINGTTDGGPSIVPVDGNAGATGQASVLERGLTSPGDTSETTAGTINVGSPDGLSSVKVGGVTLSVAQLQALSVGSPQVIDTGEGTLTLTGFSGTGSAPLNGVISYTYTLKAALNQPGASESSDLIALEVTDRGGITTTGTLTVQIVDDTPTANADANSVAEGTTSADSIVTGNVFSGSTPDVADRLGADTRANPVTAVSFGGAPQTVGSEFTTAYGHLTLNADGSYSYRLDNTNAAVNALKTGETLSETFTYTITDADGDPSTTTLTLTINGTTDGGPSIVPVDGNAGATGQASVLERGLTSPGDTSETTAGTINVGSPDGLSSVKVGGVTLSVAQLQALSVGSPQVIDTGEGTLTLTGFSGTGSAPLNGVISYTYTLKAALNQPGASESSDLIALEVTDRGGITTTGTLTVQIVDDTPTANADANSVAEGTTSADSIVTGNVFSGSTPDVADRLGADTRANPVTAVSFGGAPQTVGSEFTTAYGHLTLNADGSYSYRLDNTNAAVNALKTGETLSETFTYTITDADGDPSTTTLTLTINGTTDGGPSIVPVDGNAGATGQASVLERGLTSPGDTSETTAGTINVGSPDGLSSVKVGGVTLSVAQLQALSVGSPQVIDTGEGTLTLTGFSGTGSAPLNGVISYTYTLKAALNQPGASESSDLIALEVTDRGGITTTGTLTVQIVDDTPTANADANSVAEGTTSADSIVTGNVFSGSTPDVADRLGADTRANPVTAVSFGGAPQTVGSEFTTAYGHLTLNADGSYSYRLDNTNAAVNALKTGETLSETFTYTITDADGDPSSTTLTITINGTTDGGPSIVPVDGNAGATGQATVLEAGLTGPATTETTVGTINVGSPDGLTSVKVGGVTLTVAQLQALSVGSPQVIDTGEGTLTLTGFSGTGSAPLSGVISYTYTLKAALNQPGATESSDLIALEVTDRGGITTTGTLTVQIVDDTPTANADANSVAEGTTSADSTVTGNVFSGSAPDVADRLGADTGANPVTAVSFGGAPQTVGSEFATAYGHLTLNADGSYSYRLDNTNAAVNALKTGETLSETFTYTITDADGDPSSTTLTITINGTTDGGPSIVPVDGNAGATGQATVLEAGLTGPATTETTVGTINVGSPDGLTSVKVGGVTLTVAQLQALSVGSPQVIDTGEGTLTLTGFSGTGSAPLSGAISYTYTLKAALNQPGASESSDLIALEVTDRGGITTTGTLTVQIVDDTPTANADSNEITEDAAPNTVSGNVMTTGSGQDTLSADATRVTGAVAGIGMPGSNVASGTTSANGTTVAGLYGSIKIGADGSYSYTLDNTKASVQALNAGESTTETFTYTITDADGDPSTTTLNITIRGTDDGVALTVPDTNAGVTGNASVPENGTLTGQSFTISAPDGLDATAALTIAGTPVTKAALENSVTSNVTINTPEGVLTITGYNPVTGVVTYSYDPSGTRKDHTGGEVLDTISIVVKDDNGDTQPGNLVINIVDTAPLARPDTNTVTEDTAPNPVAGNVITTGSGADTLGADATVVTGIMAGSGTPGNNVASGTTSSNGASVNGTYGTLVQGADGSYSYTLDNARPAVQALARNQAVSETFTYTITDADGDPSSTTLTITVTGTNDVPIIDVRAGDATNASLTETNSGLIVSDTLSVFDVDTQDTVAASKVDSLAVGGTYSGARPTDAVLKGMFSVSGGEGSTVAQDAPNGITWTFDSGSEAFNSIPAGQTLILTYTVRATDSQGASVDQPVTITITGTNDGVVAVNDTLTIAENATGAALGGNVLSNDTLDPDAGATTTVSSFSLDADGNGSQDVFTPGTPVTVTTPSGTLGVLTMASNGAYTFTPHQANYSGPVPVITYTLASSTGESATATLTLNVTPVSDQPGVTRDAATVTTNEDTAVALGFNAPTVTDAVDQNGAGNSGDNPERLSLITLSGIPSGAKLLDGTNSDATLFTSTGGNITIRLSDASNLIASPGAATLTMTTAQFEALKFLPVADSGANIARIRMSVTEYEVTDVGNPISGVGGATRNADVAVDVKAVTDGVDLKINGMDGPYDATIQEDSALDLKALLSATFQDLDGSEVRYIDLAGLPVGSVVNGVVIGAAGTASIQLVGNNTLPAISLIPPANFSGDINNITVTLRAKDTDADSTVTTLNETDSVTLNLHVTPLAGDVAVANVATPEDTAVKFLQGVALTDTDGSESITGIVVKNVPTGWVLKDDAGTVVFTGNGVATYTVPAGEVSNGDFRNYTLTPPSHSSANATISLDLTTTDTQTVNGSPVTSVQTVTRSETITVNAVAETVGGDSNGDLVPDLTMTPGFVYSSQGAEDQWFNLNSDGFNLKAGWANQDADGSEQTFALLTPVLSGGSAIGSQFRYTDGSGVHVLTYNGTAVEIPMAYLNTVQFMAAPNVAGAFTIGVQARTVDTDPDTGASVSAVSGSATLTNLFIAPVADAVTLAVTGSVTGNEDSLIPLRIKPTSADPSETFNVTISNIPAGSTLVYDGTPVTVTGNSATIANFDSTKSLAIQPPANSNTDFSLNVSAVSIDTVGGVTSTSSPTALSITVDVRGVADSPAITSASLPFVTTEAVVDAGAKRIALSSIITSSALTDSDGSETLSFVLSGLPAGFTVEGLTFTGGVGAARVWAGTAAEFASATIVVLDDNYSGSFDFKFRAITTENDGNSLTGNWTTVPVQVTPSPEATINVTTTASEDTLTRVDFALQIQNGDSNETLSSVWVNAADLAGKPFTLYLGATPLTSLVADGGWYKLTGSDIGNVFVKGSANSDADGMFGVRYAITDPSNDGSLSAVTQQFDTNYSIAVNPVTDATTSSNDFVNRVIASTEVVTVNVTVTQSNDPNAGNAKDVDGSEKLLYVIVDSVPIGVTVVGGKYIGNTPGNPNTGRWILDVADTAFSGASLTQAVQFSLDGTAGQLSGLTQAISITAYTQDTGASAMATSTTNWTLQTSPVFSDTSPLPTTPAATIATWAKDPAVPSMTEDTPVSLNTLLDASISGTSPFAVTLTGLPAGTVVTGMMMTMVGGSPVWSAQGTGDNNALQALLNGITVTAPANANSNTGPLGFSATLTTYDDGGGRHDSNLTVSLPVTPVSDPIVLVATDSNVSEDSLATISIALSNVADGANTNVVGGKVYVRLDESGMEAAGGVLRFNGNPVTATTVSGVSGIADGTYFVLNGVSNGATLNLTYQPAANASGTVGYTAFVQNQETGAANVATSSTSGSFDINKVNDGVTLSAGNVTGAEDQAVQLAISAALIDPGERIQSVTLSHVPDGFQVYYGNGAPGTAATNMGGGVWSIPASAGAVPAYISLVPPPNWSGTVSGVTAEVWSGETRLDQTVNSANFDVTFNGVADGILISPTLSFGNEGQVVPLNLNSAMPDMDGSETAIITVKGLGSFAAFYAGSSLLSASYDSGNDTYTLSGLTPAQVSGLGVIQKDGSFDLVITAQTADSPGGNLSAVVSASMHVDINPVAATTGDDRLLYDGSALNGLAGVDTIEFRLGENLDFSASPVKPTNIERFDLMPAGQNHSLGHLSVQDVLDMTGSGKSLTILGDSGDSVSLKNTGGTWSAGGSQTVGGHDFDVYLNTQDPAVRVLIEQQINKSIDP